MKGLVTFAVASVFVSSVYPQITYSLDAFNRTSFLADHDSSNGEVTDFLPLKPGEPHHIYYTLADTGGYTRRGGYPYGQVSTVANAAAYANVSKSGVITVSTYSSAEAIPLRRNSNGNLNGTESQSDALVHVSESLTIKPAAGHPMTEVGIQYHANNEFTVSNTNSETNDLDGSQLDSSFKLYSGLGANLSYVEAEFHSDGSSSEHYSASWEKMGGGILQEMLELPAGTYVVDRWVAAASAANSYRFGPDYLLNSASFYGTSAGTENVIKCDFSVCLASRLADAAAPLGDELSLALLTPGASYVTSDGIEYPTSLTVSAVPEPATTLMLLTGFCLFSLKRTHWGVSACDRGPSV